MEERQFELMKKAGLLIICKDLRDVNLIDFEFDKGYTQLVVATDSI